MAKSSFYFDHDYNARNDQKILELRAEYGWNGYGIYFGLIEVLCESGGQIKRGALGGLSLGLSIDKITLEKMLDFMINIDLLHEENGVIYSNRVNDHLAFRSMLSEAGKRGGRPQNKAPLKPPLSPPESRKGEERKGDERKEKEIIIEDELTFGNFSATFEMAWKEWIEYKKSQHNFSYKTKKTEQIAINSLIKQFPNQETKAIRAIEFSIGNGYQGIFAPNENQQSSQPQKLMNFR